MLRSLSTVTSGLTRTNKESLLLTRQGEVEAAATKEHLGRRDRHDFEDVALPGPFNALFHQQTANSLALELRNNCQTANLGEFPRVNLQSREADQSPVYFRDKPVVNEFFELFRRARQQPAFGNKRLNEISKLCEVLFPHRPDFNG